MATTFKKKNLKKVPWPADGQMGQVSTAAYVNPYAALIQKKVAEAGLSNPAAPSGPVFFKEWLNTPPQTEVEAWPEINSNIPVEAPMTTDTENHTNFRLEIFIKEKDEWRLRETLCRQTYEDLETVLEKYKNSFKEHLNKGDVQWQKLRFVCSYTKINGDVCGLPEFYCEMEKEVKKDKVFLNGPKKQPLPFPPKVAKHYASN